MTRRNFGYWELRFRFLTRHISISKEDSIAFCRIIWQIAWAGVKMASEINALNCHRCNKAINLRWAFSFRQRGSHRPNKDLRSTSEAVEVDKCGYCALRHRPMLKRSAIAGVVVGTVLTLLNQGDALLSGSWNNALYWKIPLTYCVPFIVATYGALVNSRK